MKEELQILYENRLKAKSFEDFHQANEMIRRFKEKEKESWEVTRLPDLPIIEYSNTPTTKTVGVTLAERCVSN